MPSNKYGTNYAWAKICAKRATFAHAHVIRVGQTIKITHHEKVYRASFYHYFPAPG